MEKIHFKTKIWGREEHKKIDASALNDIQIEFLELRETAWNNMIMYK